MFWKAVGIATMRRMAGFLTTGKGWLALFKGEKPGLHHYI
jgi:hypothetical protein